MGNSFAREEEGIKVETQIWTARVEENVVLEVEARGHSLLPAPGAPVHSPDSPLLGCWFWRRCLGEKGEPVEALAGLSRFQSSGSLGFSP